jgi:hypothetical protein
MSVVGGVGRLGVFRYVVFCVSMSHIFIICSMLVFICMNIFVIVFSRSIFLYT